MDAVLPDTLTRSQVGPALGYSPGLKPSRIPCAPLTTRPAVYATNTLIKSIDARHVTPDELHRAMQAGLAGERPYRSAAEVAKLLSISTETASRSTLPAVSLSRHGDGHYLVTGLLRILAPLAIHENMTPEKLMDQLNKGVRRLCGLIAMADALGISDTSVQRRVKQGTLASIHVPNARAKRPQARFLYPAQ